MHEMFCELANCKNTAAFFLRTRTDSHKTVPPFRRTSITCLQMIGSNILLLELNEPDGLYLSFLDFLVGADEVNAYDSSGFLRDVE